MPVTRDLSDAKRQAIIAWLVHDETETDIGLEGVIRKSSTESASLDANLPLTEAHRRYLHAVKAKNGSMPVFPNLSDFFSTL